MKCRFQVRDIGIIGEDILFVGEAISLPPALNITFVFGRIISSPTNDGIDLRCGLNGCTHTRRGGYQPPVFVLIHRAFFGRIISSPTMHCVIILPRGVSFSVLLLSEKTLWRFLCLSGAEKCRKSVFWISSKKFTLCPTDIDLDFGAFLPFFVVEAIQKSASLIC